MYVTQEDSTRLRKRELREKQVMARMNESKKKAVKDVESQQNQNGDGDCSDNHIINHQLFGTKNRRVQT